MRLPKGYAITMVDKAAKSDEQLAKDNAETADGAAGAGSSPIFRLLAQVMQS
jgi:hypothetical protein